MKNINYLLFLSLFTLISCSSLPSKDKSNSITAAINQTDRTANDLERDLKSHPETILKLLNIKSGDTVLDVFAGGGYYSELIARIVGKSGKVYLHNNEAYLNYVEKALNERLGRIDFPQLIVHNYEVEDMNFPEDSADAAMIIMSYHDLFYDDSKNGWPQIDLKDFIGQIYTSLKKGGRFLIVDHNAQAGHGSNDTHSLHRIEKSFAIQSLEELGFKFIEESKVLKNVNDDMQTSVFDPTIKGKTNRFVLLFEK
jgi:predicted methyltransferase